MLLYIVEPAWQRHLKRSVQRLTETRHRRRMTQHDAASKHRRRSNRCDVAGERRLQQRGNYTDTTVCANKHLLSTQQTQQPWYMQCNWRYKWQTSTNSSCTVLHRRCGMNGFIVAPQLAAAMKGSTSRPDPATRQDLITPAAVRVRPQSTEQDLHRQTDFYKDVSGPLIAWQVGTNQYRINDVLISEQTCSAPTQRAWPDIHKPHARALCITYACICINSRTHSLFIIWIFVIISTHIWHRGAVQTGIRSGGGARWAFPLQPLVYYEDAIRYFRVKYPKTFSSANWAWNVIICEHFVCAFGASQNGRFASVVSELSAWKYICGRQCLHVRYDVFMYKYNVPAIGEVYTQYHSVLDPTK